MTGIVDYNAGNIRSVEHALESIGAPFVLSSDPRKLGAADRLIFPGVGDASFAMGELRRLGLDSFLCDWARAGSPLMGICLGSQIIFESSEEGGVQCLGILKGSVRRFSSLGCRPGTKVPHMGWNNVTFSNGGARLLDGIPDNSDFYFVHSYVIQAADETVVKGYAEYGGIRVPAVIESGAVSAFQFHPEKSGERGLRILRNYVKDDLPGGEAANA